MYKHNRDIILIVKDSTFHPRSLDRRMEDINAVVAHVDNVHGFCTAHELVNRNRITSKKDKVLSAARELRLKPFRFLLNKN